MTDFDTNNKIFFREDEIKNHLIKLTSFMMHRHYCENDTKFLANIIEDPFIWIGTGDREYAVGAKEAIDTFCQFSDKIPACQITEEKYDVIQIDAAVWLCSGRVWIQTDPSTQMFIRVHQRITAVFRQYQNTFRCCHIHASNPYSEMDKDDIGFPTKMSRHSYEYFQEQLKTQKKLIEKQTEMLQRMSYKDSLTGLFNRNKFNKVVHDARKSDKNKPIGIAYFDLNGLKKENDREGHAAGDLLISRTAKHIKRIFQGKGFRIGGDEFVVIDRESSEEKFKNAIETVCENMKNDGISISVGISWHSHGSNIMKHFEEADKLMYENKKRFYKN